jgi:hypothetical protein
VSRLRITLGPGRSHPLPPTPEPAPQGLVWLDAEGRIIGSALDPDATGETVVTVLVVADPEPVRAALAAGRLPD